MYTKKINKLYLLSDIINMFKKSIELLSLVFLLFFSAIKVNAVNVQQFSRSNSLTFEMIEDARLSSSHVLNHYKWLYNLGFSYVDHPLTIKNSQNTEQLDHVIDSMMSVHLGAAVYLKPYWQISANTSFSFFDDNNNNKKNNFQDLELKSKIRLYDGRRSAFTIMPLITVPFKGGRTLVTDNASPQKVYGSDYLLSDSGLGAGLFLIYEHLFKSFQVSFNLGYRFNDKAKFIDNTGYTQIDKTQVLTTGLGIYFPFHDKIGLNLEYISNFTAPFFNNDINPNEFFIGLSSGLRTNIHGFVGAGFGNIFDSSDGNDYRVIAGIKFTPGATGKKEYTEKGINKPIRIIKDSENFCKGAYIYPSKNSIVILFENDSDQISKDQIIKINEALVTYKERQKDVLAIEILGHTSTSASFEYNKNLGLRRAKNIEKLFKVNGVDTSKIRKVSSFGEESLLNQSETREADTVNRRVEINFILDDKFEGCYE